MENDDSDDGKRKNLVVMNVNDVDAVSRTVDFVFSAVDMTKEEIRAIEEAYAKTETPVVSNNSAEYEINGP